MNPYTETGTSRMRRLTAIGCRMLQADMQSMGAAHRARYGTPADVERGVADVLERRKSVRAEVL